MDHEQHVHEPKVTCTAHNHSCPVPRDGRSIFKHFIRHIRKWHVHHPAPAEQSSVQTHTSSRKRKRPQPRPTIQLVTKAVALWVATWVNSPSFGLRIHPVLGEFTHTWVSWEPSAAAAAELFLRNLGEFTHVFRPFTHFWVNSPKTG